MAFSFQFLITFKNIVIHRDVYIWRCIYTHTYACIYAHDGFITSPTHELGQNYIVLRVQNAMPFFPADLAFLLETAGCFRQGATNNTKSNPGL